jgi:surface protein
MASYRDFLPVVSDGEWVRPSDWLALPTVTEAEQKFVGLHAVFPEGNNFCAFLFRGAYTVDWGDGVVEDFADNVKAEHEYDYASISNATLTSRGYKQVIVTVTPQVGQNLTTINFQQRYTGQNQAYATGWLDVTGSFPNAGSGATITFGGTTVRHSYIERATILTIGACTNLTSLFSNCYSLQKIPIFDTSNVGFMNLMFAGCSSIQQVPLFNTINVSQFSQTFQDCISLKEVPFFNLSNNITLFNTFAQCRSLKSVPFFDTSNVINMGVTFGNCTSLEYIPHFDTSNVTRMESMFVNCNTLKSVPTFNTENVTRMDVMFQGCINLHAIPALSTASITTTAGTDFTANFANGAASLDRCQMVFARTVGFTNCQLGVDALVEIFTNLVDRSATTSATITITGNWGAALLSAGQRDIALNKNWLITG